MNQMKADIRSTQAMKPREAHIQTHIDPLTMTTTDQEKKMEQILRACIQGDDTKGNNQLQLALGNGMKTPDQTKPTEGKLTPKGKASKRKWVRVPNPKLQITEPNPDANVQNDNVECFGRI